MAYDKQFEDQIQRYRERQRLLFARNISFGASRKNFEAACRAKLSEPHTVKFFWKAANESWKMHPGSAMLGFEHRTECRKAMAELEGLEVKGRKVRIEKANRRAHAPTTQPGPRNTAAPTAAATPTPATPIKAEPDTTPAVPAASTGLASETEENLAAAEILISLRSATATIKDEEST